MLLANNGYRKDFESTDNILSSGGDTLEMIDQANGAFSREILRYVRYLQILIKLTRNRLGTH